MTSLNIDDTSGKKKIIIVGASSGMGKELARLYTRAGYLVGITGRRLELLNDLQLELHREADGKYKDHVFVESFDVTGKNNLLHIQALIKRMEGMDILLYNSGYGEVSDQLDYSIDKKIIDTNIQGFVEIVNFAFNYFLKSGGGQIAATSSVGSNRGTSYSPAYSASKAFMSNYMEGLYIKARRLHAAIFITDIQPGFVKTKMAKGNKQFWVVPVIKASRQIKKAIDQKKFRVYVSKRWWLIARLMRLMPLVWYKRLG